MLNSSPSDLRSNTCIKSAPANVIQVNCAGSLSVAAGGQVPMAGQEQFHADGPFAHTDECDAGVGNKDLLHYMHLATGCNKLYQLCTDHFDRQSFQCALKHLACSVCISVFGIC